MIASIKRNLQIQHFYYQMWLLKPWNHRMVCFGMDSKIPPRLMAHMSQGNIEEEYENYPKSSHLIYTRKMINCLQRQFSLGLHFSFYEVGRPDERPENAAMTVINSPLQKETHAPYSWLRHVFMDRQSLGVCPHIDVWGC